MIPTSIYNSSPLLSGLQIDIHDLQTDNKIYALLNPNITLPSPTY